MKAMRVGSIACLVAGAFLLVWLRWDVIVDVRATRLPWSLLIAAPVVASIAGLATLAADRLAESGGCSMIVIGWIAVLSSAGSIAGPIERGLAIAASSLLPIGLIMIAERSSTQATAGTRRVRRATIVVFVFVSVVRSLVDDPFSDASCQAYCGRNSLAVHPSATITSLLGGVLVAAAAVAAISLLADLAIRRTRPRGVGKPIVVALAMVALVALAAGALRIGAVLHLARGAATAILSAAVIALSLVLVVGVLRRFWHLRALSRFASDIQGERTTSLQEILVGVLGDPDVVVGYEIEGAASLIDAAGCDVVVPANAQQMRFAVGDSNVVIAHGEHSGLQFIDRALGPRLRMAIWNEALSASLEYQLAARRAARRRIVMVVESTRSKLERDLHDGAQQRLLGLKYEIESAKISEQSDEREALLTKAAEEVSAAFADLRTLAHGIYPSVLDDLGLEAALDQLALTCDHIVAIDVVSDGIVLPEHVARTAYSVVDAALRQTGTHRRTVVTVRSSGALLTVDVVGVDGELPLAVLDRIAAHDGRWVAHPGRWEVEVPCESWSLTTRS